jgi:hypothetical protein
MTKYATKIQPYFEAELREAALRDAQRDSAGSFTHLERAHVLGQSSTRLHLLAHWYMLTWAVRNVHPREFVGQVVRIIGAAIVTPVGLVPEGNTGGSNVSPFKRMAVPGDLAAIIEQARR